MIVPTPLAFVENTKGKKYLGAIIFDGSINLFRKLCALKFGKLGANKVVCFVSREGLCSAYEVPLIRLGYLILSYIDKFMIITG